MITNEHNISTLVINGLVLAGGKSRRMGTDKSIMQWHGKEQHYYMADMLKPLCNEVYISCRQEQEHTIDSNYNTLPDAFEGLGPFGAILSAFTKDSSKAWLIIACDLPLMDAVTLQYLISNRDINKIATTFESPHDGLPEPLITIWEPKVYPLLQSFLAEQISCPRKVLRSQIEDVKIIKPLNAEALMNANTPEDTERVKQILAHTSHAK